MHFSEAGKGGDQRPTDHNKFSSGYDLIWGKKRTNEEKRNAVKEMLKDPEWTEWSNAEVARQCDVSDGLVADVRKEIEDGQP